MSLIAVGPSRDEKIKLGEAVSDKVQSKTSQLSVCPLELTTSDINRA